MGKGSRLRQQFERITVPPAAPRLITDGALVTDDGVWAWVSIPCGSTYLMEEDELTESTLDTAAALSSLLEPGAEFHIKVMWSAPDPKRYAASWEGLQSVLAPGAKDYVDLGMRRIEQNTRDGYFRDRIVLLGMRWPDKATDAVERAQRKVSQRLRATREHHEAAHRRLEVVQKNIDRWIRQMGASVLRAERAPARIIAWAFAREMRQSDVTVPDESSLSGASLVSLMDGEVDPTQSDTYVVVTDRRTGTKKYVTVLVAAANGFPPTELSLPGGEWLEILTELPGVEASVRGVNHGQGGSLSLIEAGQKLTRSQAREASETGAQIPQDIVEADHALGVRRHEIARRLDVLVRTHPRWIVSADSPEELEEALAEVRLRYTGVVRLEVPPYVQGLLWQELLPGDRTRVPEFAQEQPMRTLAGAWAHGGSAVGDDTGPYLGANLGSTPGPVQVHIVSRAGEDKRRPTSVAFTGRSGGGKSTSLMLVTLGALAEGAWSLLVDPKGDLRGIVEVASRVLGVQVQTIDAIAASASGTMDPMRFAPSADEAQSMTLTAMLGALSAEDRRRSESVVEAAIDAVLRRPRTTWSSAAVMGELVAAKGESESAVLAREVGERLLRRAQNRNLRAVLGPLAADAAPMMTGRGLVYLGLAGLELPRHTSDADKVAERCALVTFRTALAYALMMSREVPALKKLVCLTELHVLTDLPEGRSFIGWLARVGRALQVWLLMDTQDAQAFAQIPALAEQLVMALAFQADGRAEQDAQAVLLGRPESGPRLRHAQANLSGGQCIVRDRHGRLGQVQVDRLTEWIAEMLSTDAAEDSPDALTHLTQDTTSDPDSITDPRGTVA